MIETCEESGSYDLPAYLEHLAPRLGTRRFRRRPRFRLRRLRAAVGHHFTAGYRRRHADRRGADRRRAFGRCERRRAVVVPDRAPPARPPRGFGNRPRAAARNSMRRSPMSARRRRARQPTSWASMVIGKYPFTGSHEADGRGTRGGAAQSHVASGAVGGRRRRPAVDRERRQCAASAHVAQAVAADPADARRRTRDARR